MPTREFHPPHIIEDADYFFLTATTVKHARLLPTDTHRERVCEQLHSIVEDHGLKLFAWVVLADHYHILVQTSPKMKLPRFVQRFHAATALRLNQLDATPRRKVWYQYWETTIRAEGAFWGCLNYIHINPLKHGYTRLGDGYSDPYRHALVQLQAHDADIHAALAAYPWSSYGDYLRTYGEEFLTDLWLRYPVPRHMLGDVD